VDLEKEIADTEHRYLLAALEIERRYAETASPFQWTFSRKDLTTLLTKIENKRLASAP